MQRLLVLLVVSLILSYELVSCEVFSSTDGLVELIKNKEELLVGLRKLVGELEGEVKSVKSHLKSVERSFIQMRRNPQEFVYNPLNAFMLIKTLTYDIAAIQNNLLTAIENFEEATKSVRLSDEDFKGALGGFYRLQQVYDLKSEDLARGIVDGKKVREPLTSNELYAIGSELMEVDRKAADEFLKLALEKSPKSKEILAKILENQIKAEWLKTALETVLKMAQIDPENKALLDIKLNHTNIFDKTPPDHEIDLGGTHWTAYKNKKIYSQACKGLRKQSPAVSSKLYCKFHSTSAFTKIAPFKMEIMNFEPLLAVFHQIISDDEIKVLKKMSQTEMTRAGLKTGNSTGFSDYRVAQLRWMTDEDDEVIARLSRRTSDMTGLTVATSEKLQVQNYGIGGHYNFHHDYSQEGFDYGLGTGNRIATTMFYLTDVAKGGATVFPFLRIYVPPRKGTATFWHNLSSSGDRETLTLHAGCPVLVGTKWVANKWLHEFGQELRRPCELQPKPTEKDYWGKFYSYI